MTVLLRAATLDKMQFRVQNLLSLVAVELAAGEGSVAGEGKAAGEGSVAVEGSVAGEGTVAVLARAKAARMGVHDEQCLLF
jgi:hypothetical protein